MAKRNRLTKLRLDEVSLVDDPANPGATVTLYKRNGDSKMSKNNDLTPEALAEALQKAEQDRDAHKARADAAEGRLAKIAKGETPDPYAGLVPEVAAELRKRDEKVAEQAAKIAKMEEAQELGEYIAKAASFKSLPVDSVKVGPILRKVAKALSAEEFAEVERLLKAGNEAAQQAAITKELGAGGKPQGDAEAKLAKMASDRAAKDGVSFAKAYTIVLGENPELYQQHLAEKAGK